jgi:hypothetical protein
MRYLFLWLFLAQPLAAQTFSVTHEKRFRGDGRGTIEVTDEGIRYSSERPEDSRNWPYRDIQHLDRISPREFVLLSYEDETRYLGRDRSYRFVLTEGELTDAIFEKISRRLGRPVTDRVVPDKVAPEHAVPVKHNHTFGGCEGVLRFTGDAIVYDTENRRDARVWKLGRDIGSVWSRDRYHLEIHVYENNRRKFGRTRAYDFSLKAPLDPALYKELRLRLYDLEAE